MLSSVTALLKEFSQHLSLGSVKTCHIHFLGLRSPNITLSFPTADFLIHGESIFAPCPSPSIPLCHGGFILPIKSILKIVLKNGEMQERLRQTALNSSTAGEPNTWSKNLTPSAQTSGWRANTAQPTMSFPLFHTPVNYMFILRFSLKLISQSISQLIDKLHVHLQIFSIDGLP